MENINFEDFKKQCNDAGIYRTTEVIVEWLNIQNLTYDIFCELVHRYSHMNECDRERLVLPFADKSM